MEPIFEEFQHGFKVTLSKKNMDEGINEGINSLYSFIKDNQGKRVSQIEKELHIPAKTLERWVKQLRDEAKIEYLGSKKTGGYFIK